MDVFYVIFGFAVSKLVCKHASFNVVCCVYIDSYFSVATTEDVVEVKCVTK